MKEENLFFVFFLGSPLILLQNTTRRESWKSGRNGLQYSAFEMTGRSIDEFLVSLPAMVDHTRRQGVRGQPLRRRPDRGRWGVIRRWHAALRRAEQNQRGHPSAHADRGKVSGLSSYLHFERSARKNNTTKTFGGTWRSDSIFLGYLFFLSFSFFFFQLFYWLIYFKQLFSYFFFLIVKKN